MKSLAQGAGWLLLVPVLLLSAVWGAGAIWFDAPYHRANPVLAVLFLMTLAFAWWRGRSLACKVIAWLLLFCAILALWLTQQPRLDRDWQPNMAETAWAEIHGDTITLHNVRNSHYRTKEDCTPRWETRTVHLSQLTGFDIFICYWGSPWMAHPVVSFQFKDQPPLCFSIETRKERGEGYSAIGGLFRQFELIYVVADERDALASRWDNEMYLYRTMAGPEAARERFLEYLTTLNQLHTKPRWYHALFTNCTTTVRAQRDVGKRVPWDWRMLVNGKGDELLYERGTIRADGLPFAELRTRARVPLKSPAEASDPDFSRRIRLNRPGFGK